VEDLDGRSRTLRFTLDFNAQAFRLAKGRWTQVSLYATSFVHLLPKQDAGIRQGQAHFGPTHRRFPDLRVAGLIGARPARRLPDLLGI
jgi:hypothetical protein